MIVCRERRRQPERDFFISLNPLFQLALHLLSYDVNQACSNTQDPLGPLGFNFAQHSPTARPSVERTAEKAFMLSDRV